MGDISVAFVKQYGANVDLLCQQKGSKLRNCVRVKTGITGRDVFFDQIGSTTAVRKTTRNADTPIVKTDHQRRKVPMYDWEWADLLDKSDQLKILIDPASDYAINAAFALGRAIDESILDAAEGTAYTDETGSTSTTFSTGCTVSGTSGLSITKLLNAKKTLDNNDVDDSETRFIAVTGYQLNDLLNTTQVTSADYNSVKALVNGQIDTYAGFKFRLISTDIVNLTGTSHNIMAWAQNGIGLALAKDITHRIDERSDKSYATQVFSSMSIGASRLDEDKVVEIFCLPA